MLHSSLGYTEHLVALGASDLTDIRLVNKAGVTLGNSPADSALDVQARIGKRYGLHHTIQHIVPSGVEPGSRELHVLGISRLVQDCQQLIDSILILTSRRSNYRSGRLLHGLLYLSILLIHRLKIQLGKRRLLGRVAGRGDNVCVVGHMVVLLKLFLNRLQCVLRAGGLGEFSGCRLALCLCFLELHLCGLIVQDGFRINCAGLVEQVH